MTNKNKCSVKDCSSISKTRGYCGRHYQQVQKFGEIQKYNNRSLNQIVDKKTYYELILTDKDYMEVGRAKIDKDDLPVIQHYGRWHLKNNGYVGCTYKRKTIVMHRIIIEVGKNEFIDHVRVGKKYKSDNRKNNLRVCSIQQNNYNTNLRKDNTSGFKGVSWNPKNKNWRAIININKETINIGSFPTPELAYKAYSRFAKEHQGEFYNEVC